MFELNLIKDKAKARQRRRVIFLSIVCILFLSGLTGIFVGSLYWNETTKLKDFQQKVSDLKKTNDAQSADLGIREPKAIKRRNGLIESWRESMDTRKDRLYFTQAVADLHERRPQSADFWYREVHITTARQMGPNNEDRTAIELMAPRALDGSGYMQIEASEILTQRELDSLAVRMEGMIKLVGQPKFTLDVASGGPEGAPEANQKGQGDERQYTGFRVQAAQQVFTGGRSAP